MGGVSNKSSRVPVDRGFNFTLHMRALCSDLAARLPELAHVEDRRVAIRFCQARKAVGHGVHATLTPLRFKEGQLTSKRHGRTWTVERLYDASVKVTQRDDSSLPATLLSFTQSSIARNGHQQPLG